MLIMFLGMDIENQRGKQLALIKKITIKTDVLKTKAMACGIYIKITCTNIKNR